MLLPFTEQLVVTNRFDSECAVLADRHYSRRTVGDRQFMPPGRTLVIRNHEGTLVFGWNWQFEEKRADGEFGYCCSIFRNKSGRKSSEVILECERVVVEHWGPNRMFTYVNPSHVSVNPGYCFKAAGWIFERKSIGGLHLLVKD